MSLLHPQSSESVHSGLDLFSLPITQTSIEEGHFVEIFPLATLSHGAPIEFAVSGETQDYLDLSNTYLHIQVQVQRGDGSYLQVDDIVGPTNLFLHSLFSQIDLSLNGTLITNSDNNYPYRAFIETFLNYSKETQCSGHLQTEFLYNDTPGQHNDVRGDDENQNEGFKTRKTLASKGNVIDLMGRIHSDLFSQERYLLSGIDLKLRLIPSKSSFCLMAQDSEKNFKANITHASLFVRRSRLNPMISLAHNKALEKGNVKYPIKRNIIKTFSIPQGYQSTVQDNLFLTQIPNKLIICLVASSAFNGCYQKNPFNFEHFNLNYLGITISGQFYPGRPLTPNFHETGCVSRSYLSTLIGSGLIHKESTSGFSLDQFKHGWSIFAHDLTPSLLDNDEFELIRSAPLRIELKFHKPLEEPVTVICYAVLDGLIEITKSRQILTDFAI